MNRVWIVGRRDYGDNGWSIAGVFSSREAAEQWMEDNSPPSHGWHQIETDDDSRDDGWEVRDASR